MPECLRLGVGLVLLELYACNQPGTPGSVLDDDAFLTQVFAGKRLNGWITAEAVAAGNPGLCFCGMNQAAVGKEISQ
ncbi:MAG: hypothetical protein ABSG32_12075 [Terriglobia bacterium]